MNVSAEKKKAEALSRMKELGLYVDAWKFGKTGKIRMFMPNADLLFYVEGEDLERVRGFERRFSTLVFAVIRTYSTCGTMDSFLFVSDYPEEWEDEHRLLRKGEVTAYVYNHDLPCCSDMGNIGFELIASSSLCRTW